MLRARALFLMGPTASGKTALAIDAALEIGAEIISCDSRQIFRGMAIGTAAPTDAERTCVRHHLVGVADPTEAWSAGHWAREAAREITSAARRGRSVLIVGGSGLYARALRWGLAALPRDEGVRAALSRAWEVEGGDALHRRLQRLDPVAAAGIHPRNRPRVLRALEVCLVTGTPISRQWEASRGRPATFPAPLVALDVPREALYTRIDARVEAMFRGGLLEEARALVEAGITPAWPAHRTLGYPEAVLCVMGELTPEEAIARVQRQTRAFARRQLTWLRGERDVRWIRVDPQEAESARRALGEIVGGLPETALKPLDAPPGAR